VPTIVNGDAGPTGLPLTFEVDATAVAALTGPGRPTFCGEGAGLGKGRDATGGCGPPVSNPPVRNERLPVAEVALGCRKSIGPLPDFQQ
jgi:hypothetical protein